MLRLNLFQFPLVARELRSIARGKSTYALRGATIGILLSVIVLILFNNEMMYVNGYELFCILSSIIMAMMILLAPLLAAASVTSEMESGTLPLLFLSSLRSFDIIMGKFAATFLRLFTIALTGTPVVATSMLWGGVTWEQVAGTTLMTIALLIQCVAVSIWASTWFTKTQTATIVSFCYIAFTNFVLWFLHFLLIYKYQVPSPEWVLNFSPSAIALMHFNNFLKQDFVRDALTTLCFSLGQSGILLGMAVWYLPKSLVLSEFSRRSSTQKWGSLRNLLFGNLIPRSKATLGNQNPLLWMERRKITNVTLIAILLLVGGGMAWAWDQCAYKTEPWRKLEAMELLWGLAIPLQLIIAATASSSICRDILRERKDRIMELLLCTPLREKNIFWSKFEGYWFRLGLVFIASGIPALSVAIWNLYSGPPPQVNWFYDKEAIWMVILDFISRFSFFCLIFATSARMSLYSLSATAAILKSIGTLVGLLFLWFLACYIRFEVFRFHSSPPRYLEFYFLVGLRISLDIIFFIIFKNSFIRGLRNQSGISAE